MTVKAGETVRFFIVNKGKVPHEMVIGTTAEITEHAEMMKKMPGMVHKEANQITLAPGQRGGIVWQFAKAGTVTYACLVPGHKEAGMVGEAHVVIHLDRDRAAYLGRVARFAGGRGMGVVVRPGSQCKNRHRSQSEYGECFVCLNHEKSLLL